ncbi:uncharacterized protein LOC144153376 [Haemaphysalis longicornis]
MDRREKAEHALRTRVQLPNESVSMYVEEMTRLFRRADPNMAEETKLRHLMRGVKEQLFGCLVRNPPKTVAEFISEASVMENTLRQRSNFFESQVLTAAPVNGPNAAFGDSMGGLRDLIRSVTWPTTPRYRGLPDKPARTTTDVPPSFPIAISTSKCNEPCWYQQCAITQSPSGKLDTAAFGGGVADGGDDQELPSLSVSTHSSKTTTGADGKNTSLDIYVDIDGRCVNALVDTGADYSILSGRLATILSKVTTPWTGAQIRTAGGHIVTPIGMCTARIKIHGSTFVASFLVLRECSRDLILGMDFLREYGAVIDFRKRRVSFTTELATGENDGDRRLVLRITDDAVTIPPRSSVFVEVSCDEMPEGEAVAEGNLSLLFTQGVCIARGVVQVQQGRTPVLVTNFSNEHRHLFRDTAVAHIEKITRVADCFTFGEIAMATDAENQDAHSTENIDINPDLSEDQELWEKALGSSDLQPSKESRGKSCRGHRKAAAVGHRTH